MNATRPFGGVRVQAGTRPVGTSVLPPELSGSVPRNVTLTGGGLAMTILTAVLAVGALASALVMSVAYSRSVEEGALERVTTQAEVVTITLRRGEHPRRAVTYRYEVDGRDYSGGARLRRSDRRPIAEGTRLPISYVRSDPQASWAIGYEPGGLPLWAIPLVSIGLLLIAAATGWGVRRQWLLLSEGRVAQARVTSFKKVQGQHGTSYSVSYEFRTLSGATHSSRYDMGKTPPPVGSLVPVVYHRDTPRWSAVYPLQFVRPARR